MSPPIALTGSSHSDDRAVSEHRTTRGTHRAKPDCGRPEARRCHPLRERAAPPRRGATLSSSRALERIRTLSSLCGQDGPPRRRLAAVRPRRTRS